MIAVRGRAEPISADRMAVVVPRHRASAGYERDWLPHSLSSSSMASACWRSEFPLSLKAFLGVALLGDLPEVDGRDAGASAAGAQNVVQRFRTPRGR